MWFTDKGDDILRVERHMQFRTLLLSFTNVDFQIFFMVFIKDILALVLFQHI